MKKIILIMMIWMFLMVDIVYAAGDLIVDGKVGIGTTSPNSKLEINTGTATENGLIIKGAASQSANLLELQDSYGTPKAYFYPQGLLKMDATQPSFASGVVSWYNGYLTMTRSGTIDNQIGRALEISINENIAGGTNIRGVGGLTSTITYGPDANAGGGLYSITGTQSWLQLNGGTSSQIGGVSSLLNTIGIKPPPGKTFSASYLRAGDFDLRTLWSGGTLTTPEITALKTGMLFAHDPIINATDVAGLRFSANVGFFEGGGSITATNFFGVIIDDIGANGLSGTITNAGGLKIDKQTVGTNKVGLWLNGDGTGADIAFGPNQEARIYSTTGELFVEDGAGNVTQISPHDPETGEWIFYSKNIKTGKVVRVDMERLVKAVEKLTGEKFMIETYENLE